MIPEDDDYADIEVIDNGRYKTMVFGDHQIILPGALARRIQPGMRLNRHILGRYGQPIAWTQMKPLTCY